MTRARKFIMTIVVMIAVGVLVFLTIFVGNLYIVLNRHVFDSHYGSVDIDTAKTMDQILPWTHYDSYYMVKSTKYDSLNVKLDTINRYNPNTTAEIYYQPWMQVYYIVLIDSIGKPHPFSYDPYSKNCYGELKPRSETTEFN